MIDRKYIICVALITAGLIAVGGLLWSRDASTLRLDAGTLDEQSRGAPHAAVTIDIYPDFSCGICVGEERSASEALKEFPRNVRMVYHPYPSSEVGWLTAEALEAAAEQGKFWELHDELLNVVLFENSDVTGALNTAAQEVGLDMGQFQRAMDSNEIKTMLETARQQAVSQGVTHTSMYIDGKEFVTGGSSDLRTAIEKELGRLGASP